MTALRISVSSLLLLASCGSVTVPGESIWRLSPPVVEPSLLSDPLVLRVDRLPALAALPDDRLVVAPGPNRLFTRELDRWSCPLPDLVHDALLTGLVRSRAFAQVKGPAEPGHEDLVLAGRILDFHEVVDGDRSFGRATLDLRVTRSSDGRLLWQKELTRSVATAHGGAEGTVVALSSALSGIVQDLLQGCRDGGVLAAPAR
jgi:ABC-type uncharacterized transport system auxiliary subunit